MPDENKIKTLLKSSKEVIQSCSLSNGAIVAANSLEKTYPKGVEDYFFVWPRDAAFVCNAATVLDLPEIPENYFRWCDERGLDENNLFWHRYTPAGMRAGFVIPEWFELEEDSFPEFKRDRQGALVVKNALGQFTQYLHPDNRFPSGALRDELQPDHNALTLWALNEYIQAYNKPVASYEKLITRLADGICSLWDVKKQTFKYVYFDPWEEKIGYPGVNITYDVAVCAAALRYANKLLQKDDSSQWGAVGKSLEASLEEAYQNGRWRAVHGDAYGKEKYTNVFTEVLLKRAVADVEVDFNLVSLIYPTRYIAEPEKSKALITSLLERLTRGRGIIRYPGDKFDGGEVVREYYENRRGNTWPMFNFWAAVALAGSGEKESATRYYEWGFENVEKHFPEQIDEGGKHHGARPLAWTHALFVLASKELGYL